MGSIYKKKLQDLGINLTVEQYNLIKDYAKAKTNGDNTSHLKSQLDKFDFTITQEIAQNLLQHSIQKKYDHIKNNIGEDKWDKLNLAQQVGAMDHAFQRGNILPLTESLIAGNYDRTAEIMREIPNNNEAIKNRAELRSDLVKYGTMEFPGIHVVQPNDIASNIAKHHNITLKQLAERNPHLNNLNKLSVGQKINIASPIERDGAENTATSSSNVENMSINESYSNYAVERFRQMNINTPTLSLDKDPLEVLRSKYEESYKAETERLMKMVTEQELPTHPYTWDSIVNNVEDTKGISENEVSRREEVIAVMRVALMVQKEAAYKQETERLAKITQETITLDFIKEMTNARTQLSLYPEFDVYDDRGIIQADVLRRREVEKNVKDIIKAHTLQRLCSTQASNYSSAEAVAMKALEEARIEARQSGKVLSRIEEQEILCYKLDGAEAEEECLAEMNAGFTRDNEEFNRYNGYPTLQKLKSFLTSYSRTLEEEMAKKTLEQESIQRSLRREKPLTLEQEEQLAIKILNNQKHIFKLQGIKLDDHDAFYTLGRFYNADYKTPLEQKAAELFFKEKNNKQNEKFVFRFNVEDEFLARKILAEEEAKQKETELQTKAKDGEVQVIEAIKSAFMAITKWDKAIELKNSLLDKIKTKFKKLVEDIKAKIDKDNEEEEASILKVLESDIDNAKKQLKQKADTNEAECREMAQRKQTEHNQEAQQEFNSLVAALAPGKSLHYVSTAIQTRKQAELDAFMAAKNAQKGYELDKTKSEFIEKSSQKAQESFAKLQAKTNVQNEKLKTVVKKYDERIPIFIEVMGENIQETLDKDGNVESMIEERVDLFLQGIAVDLYCVI
ncbi:MAG: LysM peptidoglycan-binding domain-containing protein [Rickettsia endosymbiont of Platyusa sonomae]|nr:LysM peptidoglycan-binding domain-containing protein [Rickettsia endosymbiont of Platyusa sonomae]